MKKLTSSEIRKLLQDAAARQISDALADPSIDLRLRLELAHWVMSRFGPQVKP